MENGTIKGFSSLWLVHAAKEMQCSSRLYR